MRPSPGHAAGMRVSAACSDALRHFRCMGKNSENTLPSSRETSLHLPLLIIPRATYCLRYSPTVTWGRFKTK